jgi:tRNA(Ile)-lysidine synthase
MDKVLTAISRYNMLASGDRVAAAVSGGPDSVCLLHVLLELAPRLGVTVAAVAHFNHKLRGEASEEDERFVAALAARHGVAFLCERSAVAEAGGNLEQTARHARHAFFSRLIRLGVADRVATGHTSDDQAETVLFRLLRGSGLAGLAGILPVTREGLIRPLLDVTRSEVEEFLRVRGIPWREDASNQDARFSRNRIRHSLLPQLAREWNPRVSATLAHLADLAREEEQWWHEEISRLALEMLFETEGGIEVEACKLAALPKAVARRVIRRARPLPDGRGSGAATDPRASASGQAHPTNIGFDAGERILELAAQPQGEGRLELPGLVVVRSFGWLRFMPPTPELGPEPVHPCVPGKYVWSGGPTHVCFEIAERDSGQTGCVSLKLSEGRVPAPLELRGWNAGDHYRPAGHTRDQKIKELFQEARVPSWRRRFWPIVSSGPKILWARWFGAAAEFAAGDEPGLVLRIWEENT